MHTKDSSADQSLAYYIHKFLSFNNNRITLLFWQRYEESWLRYPGAGEQKNKVPGKAQKNGEKKLCVGG